MSRSRSTQPALSPDAPVRAESPLGSPRRGVLSAVTAAVLFGVSAPLSKLLVADVHPVVLGGLLYVGSGLGLAVLVRPIVRRGGVREPRLSRRDWVWLSGATLLGGVAAPPLLLLGLRVTPASTASLLLNLECVLTALVAWRFFGENLERRPALGVAAIAAGGAILSWCGSATITPGAGPVLIAAACLCWALDNNLTQRISSCDPFTIGTVKGLVAGPVGLALGLGVGGSLPSLDRVAAALGVGCVCYGVSLLCFVLGLRSLGAARTGAYFSLAPFVGAVTGVALLGDPVTAPLAFGALAMAVGVGLLLSEKHEHEHRHECCTHEHTHAHDAHHRHEHGPEHEGHEPHCHPHDHQELVHSHAHDPDVHHRHDHPHAGDAAQKL